MTQVGYWSNFGLPVYQPNTFITAGYQGTLGYGFTTAIGAKVGKPDVPVVSINGDGGFGFTLNELATLVQHRIGLDHHRLQRQRLRQRPPHAARRTTPAAPSPPTSSTPTT